MGGATGELSPVEPSLLRAQKIKQINKKNLKIKGAAPSN